MIYMLLCFLVGIIIGTFGYFYRGLIPKMSGKVILLIAFVSYGAEVAYFYLKR